MNVNEQKSPSKSAILHNSLSTMQSKSPIDTNRLNLSPSANLEISFRESNSTSRHVPLGPFLPHQIYARNIREEAYVSKSLTFKKL